MMAVSMRRKGYKVGVLDADITGPSIPKLFGVHGPAMGTEDGINPVESHTGIKIMSINLLLEDEEAPVVWRGLDVAFCVRRFMLRRTAGTVSVAVAAIVGTCFTHVGIAPFICAGRGAATAPFRHRSPFCGMGRTLLVYRVRAQNASAIKTNSTPNQQKCPNCMGDTSS